MKIRILSDLHFTPGINGPIYKESWETSELFRFAEDFKKPVDVNLIAGDISESIESDENFLNEFFPNQKVIFIDGNHCIYHSVDGFFKPILSDIKRKYKEKFPKEHLFWTYLENDWVWLEYPNIAVIGSTFYTNYKYCDLTLDELNNIAEAYDAWYKYYGLNKRKFKPYKQLDLKTIRHETMSEAICKLNDFQWGKESMKKSLSPEYYLKLHNKAKREVKRCHDEIININPNAKIILMTHHCLSPQCISEKYKKTLMNASFVSNLENWVDKRLPNVKLVISGHVHSRNDFTFGKRNIRYITNPCGYFKYNEPFNEPKFNPNLIIDTNEL